MPSRDGDTNRVAAVLVAGILALLWADPAFASDVHRAQIVGGGPGLIEALIVGLIDWMKRQPPQHRVEPVFAAVSAPAPVAVVAAPVPEPAPATVAAPTAEPIKKTRRPRTTLDAWAREYIGAQTEEVTAAAAYAVYSEDCRVRRRKIVPRLEFGRAFENAALAMGRQRVKRAGRLSYAA